MILFIVIVIGLFFSPLAAQAGFLDSLGCIQGGNCGLNDIAQGFILLIKMMLGAMGAVALVYFVYGGAQWLISSGRADRVQRGKDIMINTIFAIMVAFGGYIILDFFVNNVLNVKEDYRINVDAECLGRSGGVSCGDPEERKVCTGVLTGSPSITLHSEECVSRCAYLGLQVSPPLIYSCATLPTDSDGNPILTNLPGMRVIGESSSCPAGQFCTTYNTPIDASDIDEDE